MMKTAMKEPLSVVNNNKQSYSHQVLASPDSAAAMDTLRSQKQQTDDDLHSCNLKGSLARAENYSVAILRIAVISTLIITAAVVSAGVYIYTRNEEHDNFTSNFEDSALQVIESFHDMVERSLGAVSSLSTDFTSYAIQQQEATNRSFPFVTLPNFAERGSHFRVNSGSHIVHWTPLVTEENREKWEQYALENRGQIDEAFEKDAYYRAKEDEHIRQGNRGLQEQDSQRNETVLDDGTGYHPILWSSGAIVPLGDEPAGSGPYYLPTWQRSPISPARQDFLNLNWANTQAIGRGFMEAIMQEKKAYLRNAIVPVPKMKKKLEGNLRISQYREHVEDYIDGLNTFLVYPVFDSFGENKQVAGVLSSSVYWKMLLSHLLPVSSQGIICVIENSFNQTFTYRIDGPVASFIGMGDPHAPKYDNLGLSQNINAYLQRRASPLNRAYTTVPISDTTQYTIRVFPSQDTEDMFVTNKPLVYTVVVITGFAFASFLFLAFSYVVERRQHIMIAKVLENAERVTATERELNEFLAHEVRNPLSAAISACSFVTSALHEKEPLKDSETIKYVRDDIEVVNTSLNFINDFLRSMLDIHRADGNQIKIKKSPTDLLRDILEPVSSILHKRVASFEVIVQCPNNLIVHADCIRLKQVVLNLVRNSSKFVEQGFIRIRAALVDQHVRVYVEDSGPGIPLEKRKDLFAKYQQSLDRLNQGTGLGLNLCKKLMLSMDGDVWLDESYYSGIEGRPGACFVVQLNAVPLDIESVLPNDENDNDNFHSNGLPLEEATASRSNSDDEMPEGSSSNPSHNLLAEISQPTIFTLEPLVPVAAVPETPPLPELPTGLAVLFVDDDAVLRKLFMRAVRKVAPSWNIQEASSGEAALRLCDTNCFDLVFLDQYMASVDKQMLGTETAQAMRSRGIKSIICGLSANDIRDSFISSGADDFFLKPMPCKAEILQSTLLGILQKSEIITT